MVRGQAGCSPRRLRPPGRGTVKSSQKEISRHAIRRCRSMGRRSKQELVALPPIEERYLLRFSSLMTTTLEGPSPDHGAMRSIAGLSYPSNFNGREFQIKLSIGGHTASVAWLDSLDHRFKRLLDFLIFLVLTGQFESCFRLILVNAKKHPGRFYSDAPLRV